MMMYGDEYDDDDDDDDDDNDNLDVLLTMKF